MNKAKKKSAIILILLVAMVTMSSVISVFAISSEFVLAAAKTNVKRGDSVLLTVKTKQINEVKGGFNAYSGTLGYDTVVFSKGETKTSVAGWAYVYNPSANTFLGNDPTGMDFKSTDIDVFTVVLEVLDSAPLGPTTVDLSKLRITDGAFRNIVLEDASITLNIEEKAAVETPKSSNNKLSELTVDKGSLNPVFNTDTTVYNVSVENDETSINVGGKVQDALSSILSGTGSHELKEGSNVIKVVVKAEDGKERTYTINVTRKPKEVLPGKSDVNTLEDLKVKDDKGNDVALSPAFDKNKPDYSVKVPEGIDSIDVSGIVTDPGSTIVSGGGKHTLKDGQNVIEVVVRAEDGTEKKYTITVDKPADTTPDPNPGDGTGDGTGNGNGDGNNNNNGNGDGNGTGTGNNAGSTDITINNNNNNNNNNSNDNKNSNSSDSKSSNNFISELQGLGNLNTPFDKNNNKYTTTVGKEVTNLNLSVVLEDPNAKYRVLGSDNLKIGSNTVIVEVTAANGDVKEYEIEVVRTAEESSALLSTMSIGGYAINPGFREDIMFYQLVVDHEVSTLGISATSKHGGASVNIAGNNKLHPGLNYVKVSVSANGQMNTYIVEVIRENPPVSVNYLPWIISGITGFIAVVLMILLAYKSRPNTPQAPQPPQYPYYPVQPPYPYPTQQHYPTVQPDQGNVPGYFKQ